MINSVFGKTMENLRKRINVRLINNAKNYVKCVSKPTFVSQKIFSKSFAAIHKSVLVSSKKNYVGFCILELSKLLMYDFHYGCFKNKFNSRLLFTDTNSLVYEIKDKDDIYEKIYSDRHLFDFSDYPKEIKFYDVTNKNVFGKMKDEFSGEVIFEFIGLKSKMYSLISDNSREVIKTKGVNKKLKHNEFIDVLFNKKVIRHNMKRIQSKLHRPGTYDVFKISLYCFDDKRYALDNGVNTLAYIHKDISSIH